METPDFKKIVEDLVETLKTTLGIELTFDENGIKTIDNEALNMHEFFVHPVDNVTPEEIERQKLTVAAKFGAFVGEVIAKEFEGEWEFSEEMGWHIKLRNEDIRINVIGKFMKMFDNGSEDSVLSLYKSIPAIIKQIQEKDNEN